MVPGIGGIISGVSVGVMTFLQYSVRLAHPTYHYFLIKRIDEVPLYKNEQIC